jgi:hypothetical protein
MRRTWTFLFPALLALVGCSRQPPERQPGADAAPSAAAASSAPTSPSATPAREEPIPDPITHPCVVTSAQFDIAFRDGDKSCQTDADCECVPEGVSAKRTCGAVTSRKTGAKLRALAQEFTKMRCTPPHPCPQRACKPRCEAGSCQ